MRVTTAFALAASLLYAAPVRAADDVRLEKIEVTSSLDASGQPSLLWAPDSAETRPTPLFVYLHSWSGDYRQNNKAWLDEAVQRGWIYLHPNFRGPNRRPEACGSKLARQDVLDAIDFVLGKYRVDRSRIYLAGSSGGGHMTMLMAAYHPDRFSAASAWVGISDLAEWHHFHARGDEPTRYARDVVACCGGPPGASKRVDAEYKARSPIFHLQRIGDLPLDLNAGVNDGHTGSVPIVHTLRAFNVIARAGGHPEISEAEIGQLTEARKLSHPKPSNQGINASYGREIRLRRRAGATRVTIFDGGHEGLARPACEWLAKRRRATKP